MSKFSGPELVKKLNSILSSYEEITFAYLFGSFAKGYGGENSDIDIGVYYNPENEPYDFEDEVSFPSEDDIWRAVEYGTGKETDMVVLNRSPATVCAAVLHEGTCLFIRNREIFLDFFLRATVQAEDFREFERDYAAIKKRSLSLNEIDRNRLVRIVDFCAAEIEDVKNLTDLSKKQYIQNSTDRRNIERLIENLVNSSIDIAKIILASEKKHIPQTYRETVENLGMVEGFNSDIMKRLASHTKLRNILAHEYLDIKFIHITGFLEHTDDDYLYLINTVSAYLQNQLLENE